MAVEKGQPGQGGDGGKPNSGNPRTGGIQGKPQTGKTDSGNPSTRNADSNKDNTFRRGG